jgi:mitochondrial cardiolipin hydrolase
MPSRAFFSPGDDCLNEINRLLRTCQRQCDICVFTITDDRISEHILRAHQRGVLVRIITDDSKIGDPGSDILRLKQAGIAVMVDVTPAHMHHKFAIFDGTTLLNGSYNWTRSASKENEENIVVSEDAALIAEFQWQFDQLWKSLSEA